MLLFNFLMGVAGLILAGDSFGQGVRKKDPGIFAVGGIELIAGLHFIVAAIGSAS